jgi:methyltransferase-like protein
LCKQCLAPNGVAIVSYGTYPGHHARRAIREMMQYHSSRISDPHERATQAKALVSFLNDSTRDSNQGYATMLREEVPRIREKLDAYLLHNDLELEYHPVYFAEFMNRATRAGLQFLEEAEITSSLFPSFAPEVLETIDPSGDDQVRREQYVDFLTNRAFRETLLCHDHVSLRRAIGPDGLRPFLFTSRGDGGSSQPALRSTAPNPSSIPIENVGSSTHALSKSALQYLALRWPRAVSFEELVRSASAALDANSDTTASESPQNRDVHGLLESLWQAFATNLVELHVYTPPVAVEPNDRPVAAAFARIQAMNGTNVTNLWHEVVQLDGLTCYLLAHLDGTRDRQTLVDMLVRRASQRGMVVQQHGRPIENPNDLQAALAVGLEMNLRLLARHALLLA